jgi:membrane protein implicated in regulation of membrane protease activity
MTMTWTDFYLICFLVGAAFTVASMFSGSLHLPHIHLHVGGHHSHGPQLNIGTVAAFLVWFGGTGYLLVRYFDFRLLLALGLATIAGLAGASIVFFFLAKVLIRTDEVLDPADYEMVGVLGRVSSGIRLGGTGELIFSQEGCRRAAPARSANGVEIAKGTEVVVIRYESGIAYVQPWDDLAKTKS